MWTLWKTRNDLVFNDKVISKLEAAIYKMVFLSHWMKLLAERNMQQMEVVIGEIGQACGLDR